MGKIIWLTGNSGSGKTTLANMLDKRIPNSVVLDGDEMRSSISLGWGFGLRDRQTHNERVARLADVLSKRGHTVIVAVIAPTEKIRRHVTNECHPTWVYIKRTQPERENYPYTPPENPDILVDNDVVTPEEGAAIIMEGYRWIH